MRQPWRARRMKMKKVCSVIDAFITLAALLYTGYAFVCASVLLMNYHDFIGVLGYAYKTMIAFILYVSWMHKWFYVRFREHPHINFPTQVTLTKPGKKYSIKGIQYWFIILYALIVLSTGAVCYHFFLLSSFLTQMTGLLIFTLLCVSTWWIRYRKKDIFIEGFLQVDMQSDAHDNISEILYRRVVGCRFMLVGAYIGFALFAYIFLILFIHVQLYTTLYFLVSLLFFLYIILHNFVLCKYYTFLYIEETLKQGFASSAAKTFQRIYASRSYLLKPKRVEHLMVVRTLYELGLYEEALRLLSLLTIKKDQAYAYYHSVMTFLCLQQLHDSKGAQQSIEQIEGIWTHARYHNRMLWQMGRDLYNHGMNIRKQEDAPTVLKSSGEK